MSCNIEYNIVGQLAHIPIHTGLAHAVGLKPGPVRVDIHGVHILILKRVIGQSEPNASGKMTSRGLCLCIPRALLARAGFTGSNKRVTLFQNNYGDLVIRYSPTDPAREQVKDMMRGKVTSANMHLFIKHRGKG